MDTVTLRPEKELRTMWHAVWTIISAIGTLVLLLLGLANPVVFWLLMLVWLLVMPLIRLWWIPAYYDSIRYAIEDDAIRGEYGVFWKRFVTVPFTKITNIDVTQGPLQRAYGISTIGVQTAGAGGNQGIHPELRLVGIRDVDGLREMVREKIRACSGAGARQPVQSPAESKDQPVLRQMLRELQSIRELLQNR